MSKNANQQEGACLSGQMLLYCLNAGGHEGVAYKLKTW